MKVLWQVNIVMPDAAKAIGFKQTNFGGWLVGAANMLKQEDIQLTIVTVSYLTKRTEHVNVNGIEYYVLPSGCDYRKEIWDIIQTVQPELIHIHGTEYEFNTQLIHLCKEHGIKSVVSLQGIMFVCAEHYMDGMPEKYNSVNPMRRILQILYYAEILAQTKEGFCLQGEKEKLALKEAEYVIGRTTWDRETALSVNPDLKYFHVNENLRPEFYTGETWSYDDCQKHMIFISQASYPIKGLHMLLPVLPELIQKYPDLQVCIGGPLPHRWQIPIVESIADYLFEYLHYIKSLIRKYKLKKHIKYTGPLTAQQMKEYYLKCNVFVSLSSIENESNSISEAKMLGVPVVASSVGGVKDRVQDDINGLTYDYFDTDSLIKKIDMILDMKEQAHKYGIIAQAEAKAINDREVNKNKLIEVYKNIIGTDDIVNLSL